MRILTRDTATGKEYWDTKEKRSIFVPVGKQPDFYVTAEPVSMIGGIDLATGKDMTAVTNTDTDETGTPDSGSDFNIDGMNVEQLLALAEQSGIDVPGTMKKEETIRNFINNALTDAVDDE